MPVKKRQGKRRTDEQAELTAWSEAFETQFDFFGELEPSG